MFKYSMNLAWSEDDSCYVATVAEFPGLSAFGESPEEAAKEAKTAVDGFLKVYEEDGDPVPEPNMLKPFSGQIRVRLPKTLHAELSQEAQEEGISLNMLFVSLLSERHVSRLAKRELSRLRELIQMNLFSPGLKEGQASSIAHDIKVSVDMDSMWPTTAAAAGDQ